MNASAITLAGTGLSHFRQPEAPVARVLHQIRTVPGVTRGMLRDGLGYSQPSVTRHVRALMEAGLVEEHPVDPDGERTGRPHVSLSVDASHVVVWGAHMGLRSTVVAASDGAGRLIREESIDIPVAELPPEVALDRLAQALDRVGVDLPRPVSVGAAFSSHLDRQGAITSPAYGWDRVNPGVHLSAALGHAVAVSSGVAAMAGRELSATPLDAGPAGSTLYFYAREVVNHAWIVNGAVHRAHSGQSPESFVEVPAGSALAHVAPGAHPLGKATVVHAARRAGLDAPDFPSLVALAETDSRARALLDERADLIARAILLSLDVMDPETLVLAGDGFRMDRKGLRTVVTKIRARRGGPDQLRINLAGPHVIRDAALLAGLHQFWRNPLDPEVA
ncbi:ROK family transcriptional regulator [Corynebacterium comes]|uniref:MarR family protein n=1 Tax=Corynebacterium comes TaxID=2675218 RepID=A0A6B8VVF3_9CORY|nr:ROK family transcriptional regulator [Corynebacterium comes]QGU03667.1 MarR family protein [Corynebacterium comes]